MACNSPRIKLGYRPLLDKYCMEPRSSGMRMPGIARSQERRYGSACSGFCVKREEV